MTGVGLHPVEPGGVAGPHRRLPSILVREHSGARPRFQAVCSCGWAGHPVEAEHTVFLWMRHAEPRLVDLRAVASPQLNDEAAHGRQR